jgi:hypothetical protein
MGWKEKTTGLSNALDIETKPSQHQHQPARHVTQRETPSGTNSSSILPFPSTVLLQNIIDNK